MNCVTGCEGASRSELSASVDPDGSEIVKDSVDSNSCDDDGSWETEEQDRQSENHIRACNGIPRHESGEDDDDMASIEEDGEMEEDCDAGDEVEWAKYDFLVAEHREMCVPDLNLLHSKQISLRCLEELVWRGIPRQVDCSISSALDACLHRTRRRREWAGLSRAADKARGEGYSVTADSSHAAS